MILELGVSRAFHFNIPGAAASHNSNLLSRWDGKCQTIQNILSW